DADGWQPAFPKAEGWQAALQKGPGGRPVVALRQGGREVGQVPLKEKQAVTAFAVLPPPVFAVPVVALALEDEQRQPSLGLYNRRSGEQVRQLTGHLDTIRSLCFSADGRLLASAAEDQTVCVWSLTDLGKVLGQRGLLRGVAVEDGKGGKVEVVRVDDDEISPENRGLLAKGDIIEGLVEGDKLRPLASARDFYAALSWIKPGKVRLKRGG